MGTGVVVAILLVIAAVVGASAYVLFFRGAGPEIVRIDGSSTVAPITSGWAGEFNNPTRQVTVAISGTGGGFQAFCRGETDLSDASRPMRTSERDACAAAGITNITDFKIAYDGLSVVVDLDNTFVNSLTMQQLCRIWTSNTSAGACGGTGGKVTQWSGLNASWPAQTIKLFSPGTASGTFDFFVEKVLTPTKDTPMTTENLQTSEDDNVLVTGVAAEPYALGYFGHAYVVENADKVRAIGVDQGLGPVQPTDSTIKDGSYPLSRPLFIYGATTHPRGLSLARSVVKDFLRFGFTTRGTQLVGETGYVELTSAEIDVEVAKIP